MKKYLTWNNYAFDLYQIWKQSAAKRLLSGIIFASSPMYPTTRLDLQLVALEPSIHQISRKATMFHHIEPNNSSIVSRWKQIISLLWKPTLLLKLTKMDEMGCKTDIGGTALLSFLYHISSELASTFNEICSSRIIINSDVRMYVGIGRYPYFWPRNTTKFGPIDNRWQFLISFMHSSVVMWSSVLSSLTFCKSQESDE